MLTLEACEDPAFPPQKTDFTYLTVLADKFILSHSYSNMWTDALIPLDFMGLETLLNRNIEGNRWYAYLKKHFFNNPKYFESGVDMTVELAKAEKKIKTNGGEGWWIYIRNTLGSIFMAKKKDKSNTKVNFFKWLWFEARYILDTKIPLTLNTNLPINSEFVCINPTDMYLRFTVAERSGVTTNSLASLFSTLPTPIPPRTKAISKGADFLPKEPFIKLSILSNLCQKDSLTGKERVDELYRLFTGDHTAGFKKGNTDEMLPLALGPGSHMVQFKVVAEGVSDITYDITHIAFLGNLKWELQWGRLPRWESWLWGNVL